jgi:GAF domain-containing protein
MPAAPRPANDSERIAALQESDLLETGAHPDLDAIVRRAAALWGTPIAALTLLDGTHAHFKAKLGLSSSGISRDVAFCGYAILQSDPLVVLDSHADWRFADNPLVLDQPLIRFYAGIPVFGQGNHPFGAHPFGALCVIDTAARQGVNDEALNSLRSLADEASVILSASRRSRRGSAARERVTALD